MAISVQGPQQRVRGRDHEVCGIWNGECRLLDVEISDRSVQPVVEETHPDAAFMLSPNRKCRCARRGGGVCGRGGILRVSEVRRNHWHGFYGYTIAVGCDLRVSNG